MAGLKVTSRRKIGDGMAARGGTQRRSGEREGKDRDASMEALRQG